MDHGTAGPFRGYPSHGRPPHNPSSALSRPEERYTRAEAGAVGEPRSSDKVEMAWQPCTNGHGFNLSMLQGRPNRQHAVASRPAVLKLPPSGTWNPNTTYQLRRWVSTAYYEDPDQPLDAARPRTMLPPSPPRTMPAQLETFRDPSGSSWWTNLEVWVEGLSKPSKTNAMRAASAHRAAAQPTVAADPKTSSRGRSGTLVTLHRAPDKCFGVGFRRSAAGLLVVSSLDPTVNMRSSCALQVNDVIAAINGVTVSARHDGDRLLRGCGTIARLELGEPEVYSSPAPVELGGKVDLVTMLTMFNEVEAANGYGAAEARRGAVPSRAPAVPNGAHTSSVEWLSLLVRGWSLPRAGTGTGTGSARKNWC